MIQCRFVWQATGIALVTAIPSGLDSAEPITVAQASRMSEADSSSHAQHEADVAGKKIVGKGAELGEDADSALWFPKYGAVPSSKYLAFARKNPESESADEALLVVAERFVANKQYEQAMHVVDTIIDRYPNSASFDMLAALGMIPSLPQPDQQKREALQAWARYINDHPNFTADEALVCKALLYGKLGRRTEAIELLEQYVQRHPNGRWAAEDARARPRLKTLRLWNRTDQVIFWHLACFYYDSGRHAKAADILTRAIKTYDGSVNLVFYYDLLAKTHRKTGNDTEEANALRQVRTFLDRDEYSSLGTYGKELALYDHRRIQIRISSLEQINERLRELDAVPPRQERGTGALIEHEKGGTKARLSPFPLPNDTVPVRHAVNRMAKDTDPYIDLP